MLLSVPLGSANLLVLSAEKDRSAPSSAPPRSVEVIRSRPLSWITRRRRPINPKSHRHREFQTGANRSRPRFIFEPPLPLSLTHALRLSGFLPTHASCERDMMMTDSGFRFLLFAIPLYLLSPSFEHFAHSHPSRAIDEDDDNANGEREEDVNERWPRLDEASNEQDARRNEILEKLQQVRFSFLSFSSSLSSSPSPSSAPSATETFVRRFVREEEGKELTMRSIISGSRYSKLPRKGENGTSQGAASIYGGAVQQCSGS